jgi:uncharacterized protein YdeI (YjbR/CyaY-like superfamily)
VADEPLFFAHPEEFRAWLERHHESASELLVGFHRKGSGRPTLTWAQAVDEALCFGWIDGVRRRVDGERYTIRFTPRRARSIWSDVNVARVAELSAQGRMRPAGRRAFEAREARRTGVYAHEREQDARLTAAEERRFRADVAAWEFFQSQPPGYRRTALHLVVSAKRPETRERRLATLIEDSGRGVRIRQLRR